MKTTIGRCSTFGGMNDTGVSATEGLALIPGIKDIGLQTRHLFNVPLNQNYGTARNLSPFAFYCAMRWDYKTTSVKQLLSAIVRVKASNGNVVWCTPADWGPNERTGRVIDLSPTAARCLGVSTDDVVECTLVLATDSLK